MAGAKVLTLQVTLQDTIFQLHQSLPTCKKELLLFLYFKYEVFIFFQLCQDPQFLAGFVLFPSEVKTNSSNPSTAQSFALRQPFKIVHLIFNSIETGPSIFCVSQVFMDKKLLYAIHSMVTAYMQALLKGQCLVLLQGNNLLLHSHYSAVMQCHLSSVSNLRDEFKTAILLPEQDPNMPSETGVWVFSH